jgi:hypothetical protein
MIDDDDDDSAICTSTAANFEKIELENPNFSCDPAPVSFLGESEPSLEEYRE